MCESPWALRVHYIIYIPIRTLWARAQAVIEGLRIRVSVVGLIVPDRFQGSVYKVSLRSVACSVPLGLSDGFTGALFEFKQYGCSL